MEFSKERNGIAEVQSYFNDLTSDWKMDEFTVEEFVCENNRVVMIGNCKWTNVHTDKQVDTPKIDIWKIEGNKVIEFREFYDTAKVNDVTRQV